MHTRPLSGNVPLLTLWFTWTEPQARYCLEWLRFRHAPTQTYGHTVRMVCYTCSWNSHKLTVTYNINNHIQQISYQIQIWCMREITRSKKYWNILPGLCFGRGKHLPVFICCSLKWEFLLWAFFPFFFFLANFQQRKTIGVIRWNGCNICTQVK